MFKSVFYPPKCENRVKMSGEAKFFRFVVGAARRGSIVVSSIPRPQLLTELRAPTGGTNPPFNRLVRGFLALLAFCYSFWAAAVSGAAVAANPRRRATARREGARAHSYASRGAAAVPWAGRSGHTMAIRGAHGGASYAETCPVILNYPISKHN